MVDISKIGLPERPPFSKVSVDIESLEIVVFDIIRPSILLDNTFSHKYLRLSASRSGEILRRIGILISKSYLSKLLILSKRTSKFSKTSKFLSPGVFGDEILIVIYDARVEKNFIPLM